MTKEKTQYTIRIGAKDGVAIKNYTYRDATGWSFTSVPGMFVVEFEDEVKFFNLDEIAIVTVPNQ